MQTLSEDSKLLRVFIGDADQFHHQPLYEAILLEAKKAGLAGGTVLKGVMSFGASSRVHTVKLLDLSTDLPLIVEIIDHEDKIRAFIELLGPMIELAGCGGLITIEKVEVAYYKPKR